MSAFIDGLVALAALCGIMGGVSFFAVIIGSIAYRGIRRIFGKPMSDEDMWAESCEEIKTNIEAYVAPSAISDDDE